MKSKIKQVELRIVREDDVNYDVAMSIPEKVHEQMWHLFEDATRESMYCLSLNAKNHITAQYLVSAGTAHKTPAHAREIFGPALATGAIKIVLVHNHPSGDSEPSLTDIAMTKKMCEIGESLDLPVVDHVIIGSKKSYHSLREEGHIR